ncbi:MAG TPA: hypothetical protein VFX96_18845 [Pyrinomonadaceae bacterium]|nr:hypothetical protein [Pyrinomonadaceae bacterium]
MSVSCHSLPIKPYAAALALSLLFSAVLASTTNVSAQVRERGARQAAVTDDAAPRAAESRRAAQTNEPVAATADGDATGVAPVTSAARRPATAVTQSPSKYKWTRAPRPNSPAVPVPLVPATAGQLIISEFRLRGTNGANDEFVEIYNASGADHTVDASGTGTGYGVFASDGVLRFSIPNGTVIPARGHYLGCNSVAYSVTSYPAGNGTTATCDATYVADIVHEDPDGGGPMPVVQQGIALFNTNVAGEVAAATRLDAVGPTSEANTLYKEGTGVRNLTPFAIAASYVRRFPGGCIGTDPGTVDANCTSSALINNTPPSASLSPQDTDDNRADFIFVDANGTPASTEGIQQRLGAPGPENLSSPIVRSSASGAGVIPPSLIDSCVASSSPPNRVRDMTNDPGEPNDTFGSLFIRRKFTNNTGGNVTRLRFRIIDITVFPTEAFFLPPPPNNFCGAPGSDCAADLRPLTSTDVVVTIDGPPCGSGTANISVRGTTLEQAASPENQPNGGGFNSSMSAGTVTLATPLPPLDDPGTPTVKENEINLQFRFGVQGRGKFRVFMITEVLP